MIDSMQMIKFEDLKPAVLDTFKRRKLALIADDLGQIPRAILISPAQEISNDLVNEILHISSGPVFVSLSSDRVRSLMLSEMSRPRSTPSHSKEPANEMKVCVSVEAREGVSTGISVPDRAATLRILGEAQPNPRKLVKPGHIFPVEARDGGVLVKNSLAEAALDLVKVCGFNEAAAFVDVLDSSGNLVCGETCKRLAEQHKIPLISISDLVRYRLANEKLVFKIAEARLPTRLAGELRSCVYQTSLHEAEHFALIKGEISSDQPVLTRVQTEQTCADVFGGAQTPSRKQLQLCLKAINEKGSGVFLYLRPAFPQALRDQVADPSSESKRKPMALMREYGIGAQILRDLGVRKIELLTSSKRVLTGLDTFGIEIVNQRPLPEH